MRVSLTLGAVIKSGVVDNILSFAKYKQDQDLKKTDGKKRSRVQGIAKLEDANKAGTKDGYKCTLILTEGDSAKALAVAGIGHIGRDYFGVFPLRGKLLNVREATGKSLTDNAEIQALKQILGLKHQQAYKDTQSLRYGHLMIMTDQVRPSAASAFFANLAPRITTDRTSRA
jgi:DNA topoisomerase-2